MKDFDPKESAKNAQLYRFDGRYYDLSEKDDTLTLQLRRSVIWDRAVISWLSIVVLSMSWAGCGWLLIRQFPGLDSVDRQLIQGMTWLPIACIFGGLSVFMSGETWTFDKNTGKVHWKTMEVTEICKIRGVKAYRRNHLRFQIEIQLEKGKSVKPGRFGFARSERAWRQDAAQIAQFLGVPLEIPAV